MVKAKRVEVLVWRRLLFMGGILFTALLLVVPTTLAKGPPHPKLKAPLVGLGPKGNTVVIWEQEGVVKSAERSVDGRWSKPVDLPDVRRRSSDVYAPVLADLAINWNGNTSLVWLREVNRRAAGRASRRWKIFSSHKSAGGSWGKPVDLTAGADLAGDIETAFDVTHDEHGRLSVAWSQDNGAKEWIWVVSQKDSTRWSRPTKVFQAAPGAPDYISNVKIAVSSSGVATVMWKNNRANDGEVIEASSRLPNGRWGKPFVITDPAQCDEKPIISSFGLGCYLNLGLTVDSTGNATAVWQRDFRCEDSCVETSSYRGGSWSKPKVLSRKVTGKASIVESQKGEATVVWSSGHGIGDVIQAVSQSDNGSESWGRPVRIGDSSSFDFDVVTDRQRANIAVVWIDTPLNSTNSSTEVIQYASLRSVGLWSEARKLVEVEYDSGYENFFYPSTVIGSNRRMAATWVRRVDPKNGRVSNRGWRFSIQSAVGFHGGAWESPVDLFPPTEFKSD